jgi:hypothetical protein
MRAEDDGPVEASAISGLQPIQDSDAETDPAYRKLGLMSESRPSSTQEGITDAQVAQNQVAQVATGAGVQEALTTPTPTTTRKTESMEPDHEYAVIEPDAYKGTGAGIPITLDGRVVGYTTRMLVLEGGLTITARITDEEGITEVGKMNEGGTGNITLAIPGDAVAIPPVDASESRDDAEEADWGTWSLGWRCGCSVGVVQVECPYHGDAL